MKKVVRVVTISLLTGVAFAYALLTRSEKRHVEEKKRLLSELQSQKRICDSLYDCLDNEYMLLYSEKNKTLRQKIDSVNKRIKIMEKSHSLLYGSPEYIEANRERLRREGEKRSAEIKRLRTQVKEYERQLDAINK